MEPGQDWKIAALTINKRVCFFVGENMDNKINYILKLANKALKSGDIPVGAAIYLDDKLISSAYNRKYKDHDSTAHAEILAIRKACKKLNTTYLNECTLYVTLEPCKMCTSAIEQAHIKKVVFCAKSPKYGYLLLNRNKKINIEEKKNINYIKILKEFFKNKR